MELILEELTGKVLRAYYNVFNKLGFGFLEKVYENAMCIELEIAGISFKKQCPIEVFYDDKKIGVYFADLLVEDKLIIELKAAESLCEEHECQLINYLRATNIEVGLLLNFGKKAQFKRKVFLNQNKKNPPKSA
jgi:GxxExxY protein